MIAFRNIKVLEKSFVDYGEMFMSCGCHFMYAFVRVDDGVVIPGDTVRRGKLGK